MEHADGAYKAHIKRTDKIRIHRLISHTPNHLNLCCMQYLLITCHNNQFARITHAERFIFSHSEKKGAPRSHLSGTLNEGDIEIS